MLTLNDFITFEYDLEHDSEHNLSHKKKFSTPKIYTAKGDLSKRWYVYFSFRDPITGKLLRQKNIYGNANTLKNKEDRLALLSRYRRRLLKLLKEGFNPYVNNTELYKSKLVQKDSSKPWENRSQKPLVPPIIYTKTSVEKPKSTVIAEEPNKNEFGMTLREAFDFSLKLRKLQRDLIEIMNTPQMLW